MSDEDLEDYEPPQEEDEAPEGIPLSQRDPKIKEAKEVLLEEYFDGENVYYGQQLEVILEARFFHWITARAEPTSQRRENPFSTNEVRAFDDQLLLCALQPVLDETGEQHRKARSWIFNARLYKRAWVPRRTDV